MLESLKVVVEKTTRIGRYLSFKQKDIHKYRVLLLLPGKTSL